GHSRPIPRAERRDLRPRESRHGTRRVQARQSEPRSDRTVPRRRLRASGAGHADGADVRLDRGRCARAGFFTRAPGRHRRGGRMSSGSEPPSISPRRLAAFAWYARRLVARRFTAVRVMKDATPSPLTRPSVFFANHAAWWDPLVMLLVARWAYPGVAFYAPIDAAALTRYPSLG